MISREYPSPWNNQPPAEAKAIANRIHTRQRAWERYGLDWSAARIAAIEAAIRAGSPEAIPLHRDDTHRRRMRYAIREHGDWFPVVYDEATRSLMSVLPAQALDVYRPMLQRLDETAA